MTITGSITDAVTNEPVPFAYVYVTGAKASAEANFEGKYTLKLTQPYDSIYASTLGYYKKAKLLGKAAQQVINFQLERSEVSLQEVVVSAGENPADIIMRKVIKKKKDNSIQHLRYYECEAYNKVEIDLYDIDEKFQNRKVMKPLGFVFDYMDSTEGKPYLPAFLSETFSDYYYRKEPKQRKEIIKATKQSGMQNESLSQFMGSMYQEVDIYADWMGLMTKDFASPIGDGAFLYYKFYLIDSSVIDGHFCYKISFQPKGKGNNTFIGDIWIADTSFAVKQVSMQVADHVNINYVEKSSVHQEFTEIEPGAWMITKDKIVIKFKLVEKAVGLIGRKTTIFRDFELNNPSTNIVFHDRQDIVVGDNLFEQPDSFWQASRPDTLSANEQGVYIMVDSLNNTKAFRTYIDIVNAIFTGYYPWKWFEFGPYLSTIGLDDVEQFRLRLGFRTTSELSKRFRVGAYIAYGFADQRWKYGFNCMVYLLKKPNLILGGHYKHDLDLSSSGKADVSQDNILAGLWRRDVMQKLNFVRDANLYIEKEWLSGLSLRLGASHKRYDTEFPFLYKPINNDNFSAPVIRSFTTAELQLDGRFAWREKFLSGTFDRTSLGSTYPILNLSYTLGIKNVLGSDFSYHKLEGSIDHHFAINPIGHFYYTINAGKVFGDLPMQLLFPAHGNETWFYSTYSFNVMNLYEFVTDRYASLLIRHHFEGFFLNKIPGIRKLKWRELITFKALIGNLSSNNLSQNILFPFKVPFPKPYMEMGFGLENIFKIFRVDAVWRLSYRNDSAALKTPNFWVLFGVNIDF
ncbi:MAG: DUF5686 family protein [Chitinophagales bacterium]|nr:DUF5686 family protein [Chitinophagales bacterium]